jgi:two-component system chemotaxis response regulator CheY
VDFAGHTALVVEDDPAIRKLLRKYLGKMGFDVQEAATGKAALSLLEAERIPQLVCLDVMLPELSGYEICEHIRATPRLKDVQVLIVSARALPSDRALAEELGANAYLIKPIRWASFSSSVTGLFETAKSGS